MKRIILTSAIIFAVIAGAFAQTPTTTSSDVTLNVILHKIQSIQVIGTTVDMNYESISDYEGGVTVNKTGHLSVFSVGGFSVKVNSALANLTSSATEKIEASSITVQASAGASTLGAAVTYETAAALTPTPGLLFSSTKGGIAEKFDVAYKGKGNLIYANAAKFVDAVGASATTTHSTTVTYSIEPN